MPPPPYGYYPRMPGMPNMPNMPNMPPMPNGFDGKMPPKGMMPPPHPSMFPKHFFPPPRTNFSKQ